MNINGKYIVLLVFLFITSPILCQKIFLDNHKKIEQHFGGKLSVKELFFYDKNSLLDSDFLGKDTIVTCFRNGVHWFRWKLKSRIWDDDRAVELFAFDNINKRLYQATNNDLYWVNGYPGTTDDVYIWGDKLFLLNSSSKNDKISHVEMFLIDEENKKIKKENIFRNSAFLEKIYTENNNLVVIVQPMKRKLNISYYFEFFMHCPPAKWDYLNNGNMIKYILDDGFNIISSTELK